MIRRSLWSIDQSKAYWLQSFLESDAAEAFESRGSADPPWSLEA
jgi:hypothetical protein